MTEPVGVPAPGGTALTVAVKVTDWPKTEGLAEEAREVVLLAWPTVWVTIPEVFVLKFPSPLYTAVRECEPTESEALVELTCPALRVLGEKAVAPSLKVTVPVGVPAPAPAGAMVAVNTTACPKTVGLVEEVNVAVVSDLLTTWLKADDVLVLKLASPLYTAVIEWEVTDKVEEE